MFDAKIYRFLYRKYFDRSATILVTLFFGPDASKTPSDISKKIFMVASSVELSGNLKTLMLFFINDITHVGSETLNSHKFAINKVSRVAHKLVLTSLNSDNKILGEHFLGNSDLLKGSVLRLLAFDDTPEVIIQDGRMLGFQGKFLDLICEHFKMDYELIVMEQNNVSWEFADEVFEEDSIDFSLNEFGTVMNSKYIDNIYTNELDGICLLVPTDKPTSIFNDLLTPFDKWVWILLLFSTFLMIPIWRWVSRLSGSRFTWNFITFNIFRYFLNTGPTGEHRMSYIEKIIVYMYLILTFLLMTAYQSLLIAIMLQPKHPHYLKTFSEFSDSEIKIYSVPIEIKDMLNLTSTKYVKTEYITEFFTNLISISSHDQSLAQIVYCSFADRFTKSQENFVNGQQIYYKLDEKISVFLKSYMIDIFKPFSTMLKPFIDRVFEAGLKSAWELEVSQYNKVNDSLNEINSSRKDMLSFSDLSLPFFLLMSGLGVSFMVFIFEILQNWITLKRSSKI